MHNTRRPPYPPCPPSCTGPFYYVWVLTWEWSGEHTGVPCPSPSYSSTPLHLLLDITYTYMLRACVLYTPAASSVLCVALRACLAPYGACPLPLPLPRPIGLGLQQTHSVRVFTILFALPYCVLILPMPLWIHREAG